MPASHFQRLIQAFHDEWNARPANNQSIGARLENDDTKCWYIYDPHGAEIARWECRRFPGCASLIVTTGLEIREDLRGQGLGRYIRDLQHRAYKRAGFVGEINTVRVDNAPQNAIMEALNAKEMGTFPSDFGGNYRLWLTNFSPAVVAPVQVPVPPTPPVTINANSTTVPDCTCGHSKAVHHGSCFYSYNCGCHCFVSEQRDRRAFPDQDRRLKPEPGRRWSHRGKV